MFRRLYVRHIRRPPRITGSDEMGRKREQERQKLQQLKLQNKNKIQVVGDDPFAVLLADDLLISQGKGMTTKLVEAYTMSEKSQLAVMEVNDATISNYGVVELGDDRKKVAGLIEKPSFDLAPSNLASIGRYVFTPDVFNILRNQPPGSGGEIQLADAIHTIAARDGVEKVSLTGERFDCGSVEGYVKGFSFVAAQQVKT